MAFDLATAKPVASGFDLNTAKAFTPEQQQKEEIKQDDGLLSAIDSAARQNPILQGLAEFQGGVNAGALGLVDFLTTDQINSVLEISGSDKRVPSLTSQFQGVPEVEGGFMEDGLAKDIVRGSGKLAPSALSTGALARNAAANLPRVAQGESALVGTVREMGKITPAQDVAGGVLSGGGGEVGQEVGGDTGRLVGSVAAPVAGFAVPSVAKGVTNTVRAAASDLPEDMALALSKGKVMTSDIFKPNSFVGKTIQRVSERIPYVGTGAVRASQQGTREQAVRDFASDFNVTADAPFEQEIVGAANTVFRNSRQRATQLRNQAVSELNQGGGVNTLGTREVIAEQLARQRALGDRADDALVNSLTDIQASLEGNFGHVANIRTSVINEITDIGRLKSPIASGGDASLESVRAALTRDLNGAADEFSRAAVSREGSQAANRWKASNRIFDDGYQKARQTELKRIFTKGDVTPEVVRSIVTNGKRSELRRLYDSSGLEGREATRKFLIQDAIERSGGFDNVNPTQLLNKLNQKNTRTASNMFFEGSARRELDGFKKFLDLTRRAQEAGVATPTGQELVGLAAIGGAAAEPTIVLPAMAATGAGARVFESGTVRNLLIKLNAAKTEKEAANIYKQLQPIILEAGRRATDDNSQEQN